MSLLKRFLGVLESAELKGLILSLTGFAMVPLWWVIGNQINEFNVYYILFANTVALGSAVIEAVVVYGLIRFCKGRKVLVWWLLALGSWLILAGVNIWTFGASTLDLKNRYSLFLSLAIAVICWLVTRSSGGKRLLRYFSISIVGVALINGIWVNYLKPSLNTYSDGKPSLASAGTISKRNIYVLLFDSLVSEDAYRDIYGQDKTPWSSYLRGNNFNVIDNAKAPGDYTQTSFGTLFNFGSYNAFLRMTGSNNPVYQYALDNGYKTAFLADNSFFGVSSGPQLNYLYPSGIANSVCFFAPTYFLLGLCNLFKSDAGINNQPLLRQVESFIDSRDKNNQWLTTIYVWYPGHSPGVDEYTYDSSDKSLEWNSKFVSNANASTYVIDQVVGAILKNDSDPVIFLMGDHGSWNFRGVDKPSNSVSKDLLEMDKFGISFAVYPKELCSQYFPERYDTKNLFVDARRCGLF